MDELVPIILGVLLGAPIWRYSSGRSRMVLSALAVLISGATATVISGEFAQSYVYLLLDLGEAAFGLAVGFAIAQLARRRLGWDIPSSARP